MVRFKLFLLGPPRVEIDQDVVEIKRRKALALLLYLAAKGDPQPRDKLVTLLWPDLAQAPARKALSRHLHELNRAFDFPWSKRDRESVGLNPAFEPWLDVAAYEAALTECRRHDHPELEICPTCLILLEEAVALYRDDFLSGFTLSDCPDFDEWQFFQTEALRQTQASALERLISGYQSQGEVQIAINYAHRRLTLDPLHEPAHQMLMRLYALNGQQSAALRQFQVCTEMLETEFGVPPAEKTSTLVEHIRSGKIAPTHPLTPSSSVDSSAILKNREDGTPELRHNLPAQLTPLVGRETWRFSSSLGERRLVRPSIFYRPTGKM